MGSPPAGSKSTTRRKALHDIPAAKTKRQGGHAQKDHDGRKTKKFRKNAAKKAPLRAASPQKARPTAKAAVKPAPVSPPAQPEAVRPTPSLPAQPAPPGERIGFVTHYYSQPSVATIRLESGTLRVGDVIHICGHTIPNCRRLGLPKRPRAASHRLRRGVKQSWGQ